MAKDKDSIILYQKQTDKCRKFMNAEQFGRLMIALLDFAKGEDPEIDDDIAMAFEFMSLQHEIDREKYERICEQNRKNALKGGAPKGNQNARKTKQPENNLKTTSKQPQKRWSKKTTETEAETLDVDTSAESKQPKQPNAKKNNHNDKRMIREDNDKKMMNEKTHDHDHSFGTFSNVELSEEEREILGTTYERSSELIDKVSVWLRGATNQVPDHFALCVKFADNDKWPKRKVILPAELPEVKDPLPEDEQEEKVAEMRMKLSGMFEA